jgi:hypothetical protein
MGRTVLAEIPMLFYLLSGYTLFLLSSYKSIWFALLAVVFWGIALVTKLQVLPFWTISLALPLTIMLFKRRWKIAGLLAFGLGGSLLISKMLPWVEQLLLQGYTLPRIPLRGLYNFTALVPLGSNRWDALERTFIFGLPTLLGLLYESWKLIKDHQGAFTGDFREVVKLTLIFLAGSWFAWYLLLSVGWARYLFPVTFVGSIFVAAMLRDLTADFSILPTIQRGAAALKLSPFSWQNLGALLAVILTAWSLPTTVKRLYDLYFIIPDSSAREVAHFLNTQTPSNALIETYESELHFLLNRSYHYPPDQTHVDLHLRNLGRHMSITYNPLAADPQYLVIGHLGPGSELYQPILASGAFRFVRTYGSYTVYERVR